MACLIHVIMPMIAWWLEAQLRKAIDNGEIMGLDGGGVKFYVWRELECGNRRAQNSVVTTSVVKVMQTLWRQE